MKRRNFLKSITTASMIPVITVKGKDKSKINAKHIIDRSHIFKDDKKISWGTNYIPGETNYLVYNKKNGTIDNIKVYHKFGIPLKILFGYRSLEGFPKR
jgi:hypothetical protein